MHVEPVVVTGIGIISPVANDFQGLMDALYANLSGVRELPELANIGGMRPRLAARVQGVDPKTVPRKLRRSMSPMSIYAYLASQQALAMANYPDAQLASGRLGVALGSTLGSTETIENFFQDYFSDHSLERIKTGLFFQIMGHSCAANVAQGLGISGRQLAPSAACATSSLAIGHAYELIAFGRQDAMLCGGADEYHPLTTAIFDVMNAASTADGSSVASAPRPFDRKRDGIVCGEGSGVLLLESKSHALARSAPILAEISGFASNTDNSSIANPDAAALTSCMRLALADAGIEASQVDYVNAHATGTLQGDAAEARAIADVVGGTTPVSSLKGHLGHTLAASGALEMAASIGMLQSQKLVATRNLDDVDEQCAMIAHVGAAEERPLSVILKNNFAMGGVNSTLVIRSVRDD